MVDKNLTAVAQHGLADLTVEGARREVRDAALHLEVAADVNAEMAEIGLSSKTGWYASVVLYGIGGLMTTIAGLLWPDVVPIGVTLLGVASIVFAGLAAVCARYVPDADWATHMRLCTGLTIFLVGAFVAGDLRQAFVLLPLFVLITPTFIYGRRFAAPYVIVVAAAMFIVLLVTPGPAQLAHAIVSVGAILMISISFMIAEQTTRRLARANRRLAYTDPLTGIANTRRLRERLTEALGQPADKGQPFVLFAIDLDNFKLVNDTFDHSTGDRVLKAVAIALEQEVRAEDLVARRGGDEFSVLVANPDGADLEELTARLEGAIERARRSTCPQITPSGSVAWVASRHGDTIASVLQRADDELHAKKLAFHGANSSRSDAARSAKAVISAGSNITRITDRDAAMRSVSAAVNRAFARPQTRSQVKFEDLLGRIRGEISGMNAMWAYCAVASAIGAGWISAMTAAGILAPLPLAVGLACGAAMFVIAGFCLLAAKRNLSVKYIPLTFVAYVAATAVAIASAGESGAAMLDALAVLALYSFYFMRPRFAAMILLSCCALYVAFAIGASYPDGGVRAAVGVTVLIVCASILTKVRSVTLRFVRTNQELSEVDALTNVANLRALRMRVSRAIESADVKSVDKRPVIVTVDLDRFKEVNDRYNHTVGDQVLESVARAISETVRVDELVARRGGDEFFILFEGATDEHIANVIPRLQNAVEHARMRICPDLIPTASIGHVGWEFPENVDEFMLSADNVMHDEKIETRQRDYGQLQA